MNFGKLGVWAAVNTLSAVDCAAFAKDLERWDYSTLWIPDAVGSDPMVAASWVLAQTEQLNVATGVASIYARDPFAMVAARESLAEQSGNRFALGLGASHEMLVQDLRGHIYKKPLSTVADYLEKLAATPYFGKPPAEKPPTLIAALGPKMLALAAAKTDGVLTYNGTPEHTAQAREILGLKAVLCVEQMVVLERDPATARAIGRKTLCHSFGLPNYRNNFRRMGFSEEDFEHDGSDQLIDAIVAWGDETAIRARIQQHWDAGADHVCIQSLPRDGAKLSAADTQIFELLAPATSDARLLQSAQIRPRL